MNKTAALLMCRDALSEARALRQEIQQYGRRRAVARVKPSKVIHIIRRRQGEQDTRLKVAL